MYLGLVIGVAQLHRQMRRDAAVDSSFDAAAVGVATLAAEGNDNGVKDVPS